jgi:hypothetical protein
VERAGLVLERVVLGDELAAAVKKHLALAGGRERPLRPLDELHAKPALQLAHDWLAPGWEIALSSGDDVAEDLEGLQVHEAPRKRCPSERVPPHP